MRRARTKPTTTDTAAVVEAARARVEARAAAAWMAWSPVMISVSISFLNRSCGAKNASAAWAMPTGPRSDCSLGRSAKNRG